MVGPFAEAIRATFQPCTFLLIVPVLAATVAVRSHWRVLVAVVAAAVVGGWLLAANRFVLDGIRVRLAAALAGAVLLAVTLPGPRRVFPSLGRPNLHAAAAGVIVLLATMWWRPCVGNELGTILTAAQGGLAGQLVPMAFYMLGAMTPVMLIALARHAMEPSERATRLASWGALSIGLVVTISLAVGQHDRVVVTLTRWTLN